MSIISESKSANREAKIREMEALLSDDSVCEARLRNLTHSAINDVRKEIEESRLQNPSLSNEDFEELLMRAVGGVIGFGNAKTPPCDYLLSLAALAIRAATESYLDYVNRRPSADASESEVQG